MEQLKNNLLLQYSLGIILSIIPALYFYYSKVDDIRQNKVTLNSTIIENQANIKNVDTISGATYSSTGVKDAIIKLLEQVGITE